MECGFANGIIDNLNNEDHWPDLSKIPALTQLLATDYRTLVNCKTLINAARDNKRIEETITREARELVNTFMDPNFPANMVKFVMSLKKAKNNKIAPKL